MATGRKHSMRKKILVAGGAGYIGSHACKNLFQNGYEPVVLDNLVYGHPWALKWGKFYQGNIADKNLVEKIVSENNIESVIHFAAYAYVGESVSYPQKYYENNLENGIRFLDQLVKSGVKNLVFSSTCATYGIPSVTPITEETPQNPINPYGKTKHMFEQILGDYRTAYGLNAIALRYFNAAGADNELEIGEDHQPETHLIPLAIRAAYDPDFQLTVYGTDYPTKDGTCIRDYIHVSDLADAHRLAIQKLERQTAAGYFDFFNLGTGNGFSVKEIITAIEEVSNKKVKIQYGARRPGDPPILVASNSKARSELGWQDKHSALQNIIHTACQWYLKKNS